MGRIVRNYKIEYLIEYKATGRKWKDVISYAAKSREEALEKFWEPRISTRKYVKKILSINGITYIENRGQWVNL